MTRIISGAERRTDTDGRSKVWRSTLCRTPKLPLSLAVPTASASALRVNSISPGWIDTDYRVYEGPDALQQPAGRVGNPMDIANMVLFLCSDKAGFITGENICIDGGMTKLMIYHDDHGWTYTPEN